MRTSVEFPEPLYREMKITAATEGTTIREIIPWIGLQSGLEETSHQSAPTPNCNISPLLLVPSRFHFSELGRESRFPWKREAKHCFSYKRALT